MEVAVSINDSPGLSPTAQHRHSRYSTPDTSGARSPSRNESTTILPIAPSQEHNTANIDHAIHSQIQSQGSHLTHTMDADGQDHDRMETDDASETSASGEGSPQHHGIPAEASSVDVPNVPDVEAMDTTPDRPDAGEIILPASPQDEGQTPDNPQDIEEEFNVNRDLVRTNSRGSTVISTSPPNTPPRAHAPDSSLPSTLASNSGQSLAIIDPMTGQPADTALGGQAAENWPSLFPTQTDTPAAQNDPSTQSAGQESQPIAGQEEDSPDEDSADEEEQPYWASFVADKSVPSEEELKLIEHDTAETSALDHEHWETLAFEPLEDPEYVPTATGRIQWTLKGFHGTPEHPNKEIVMRSPSVNIGGYYWNVKLYPRGNENTDSMSVYVECSKLPRQSEPRQADEAEADSRHIAESSVSAIVQASEGQLNTDATVPVSPLATANNESAQSGDSMEAPESSPNVDMEDVSAQESWEVPAQVLCIAYNPEEPRVFAYQKITHRYHKETADWGWTRFHGPWDRLHKRERLQRQALLQNDTLSFTVYIRTVQDHTGALWWHSPANRSEWDSFERLGLNRLWVGSPESSAVLSAVSTWLHFAPLCLSTADKEFPCRGSTRKRKARPFHDELERVRGQLSMPLKDSEEALSLMNVAEMLDWNDAGDCEPDVVSNLDILRRTLSWEALDVVNVADVKDIFKNIMMLRQSDSAATGTPDPSRTNLQDPNTGKCPAKEPSSVQEALNVALPLQISECPAVLQIELRRQTYDVDDRKWRKLNHRISINQSIRLGADSPREDEYTLFGMVVHSGDLESKDYYNVIRPKGPGTRWIKYSGDRSTRGVECLTTKQAIEAHEGGDTASQTAAVAYLITYVRTDLLSKLLSESKFSNPVKSLDKHIEGPKASDGDTKVPVCIYQSSIFENHQGLGIADWALRESEDTRLLKLEVAESITLGDLVDSIDSARRSSNPDETGKYALWFLDTVKGNPAMENIVRAPELVHLTLRRPDNRLIDAHTFNGVCRIWLDDRIPLTPEPIVIPPPPQVDPSAPDMTSSEDTMQVDDGAANDTTNAPASTETNPEQSSESVNAEIQPPVAEDGDTVMEGNADPDTLQDSAPVIPQRAWNANLDTRVFATFDNVWIFLKAFDAERQTLVGVKTLWVKQNDRVGYTVRQAMSWDDDVPIDIYQEQTLSTLEPVRSGAEYQDIAGASNYILVVQRRPNAKDISRLTAAGKPTNIPGFFNFQCNACDPAYLQPHLTRSYFASPYFSGDIAYGRPHGQGTLITTLGDAYTGTFVSGSKSGVGKMRFANGDTYTGSWANDDPDGQGEMVYAKTGNVYTGGFRKRKRHGKGIMKFEVADEEERLCGICFEEEMDCCFYDCGHVAACEGCARQVEVCPVCRRGVKAVVRIWRS